MTQNEQTVHGLFAIVNKSGRIEPWSIRDVEPECWDAAVKFFEQPIHALIRKGYKVKVIHALLTIMR